MKDCLSGRCGLTRLVSNQMKDDAKRWAKAAMMRDKIPRNVFTDEYKVWVLPVGTRKPYGSKLIATYRP